MNIPIDGRTKQDIWRILMEMQQNPHKTEHTFPATLSNVDRKYVHEVCKKFGWTSKSAGGKKGPKHNGTGRAVTVTKLAQKQSSPSELSSFLLSNDSRYLLDSFFARTPLPPPPEPTLSITSRLLDMDNMTTYVTPPAQQTSVSQALQQAQIERIKNIKYQHHMKTRMKLPIWEHRERILDTIQKNQVIIISGNTGCGKSTQLPQYILEDADTRGLGSTTSIICTQPRRISAMGLADRVATERAEKPGATVGYQIRMESARSASTRLLFCTVGILLRRLVGDRTLNNVSHIIVDEVHERDRLADFLLIILRDILPSRPHLKLILMSATINANLFSEYFNAAPILVVPGFTYPVQTFFLPDVIELTGYVGTYGFGRSKGSTQQQHQSKEKKLQSLLENLVQKQLMDDSASPPTSTSTSTTSSDAQQASLDALLAGLTGNTQLATSTGYDDSYKHITTISTSSFDDPQHPHAKLHHSETTLSLIKRMEEDGMDVIDYDLVVETVAYICTHYSDQHVQTQSVPKRKHEKSAPSHVKKRMLDDDEDEQFTYELITPTTTEESDSDSDDDIKTPVTSADGAILIFCPGWDDINKLIEIMGQHSELSQKNKYLILPLHGSIAPLEQRLIFKRPSYGMRKIVISTNVAESSITIDDVVFVVDVGKMKEKTYDSLTKMSSLTSTWISKANAMQRAGRAGRCRKGVCFRLYTENMYAKMDEYQLPEMLRTPLEELVLQVKMLGLGTPSTFLAKALQPPSPLAINAAVDLLMRLGAISAHQDQHLTDLGWYLANLPVEPRLGKMIVYGVLFKCIDPILTIVACLSYRDPFVLPMMDDRATCEKIRVQLSNNTYSDPITLLHAYYGYQQALERGYIASVDYCRRHFLSPLTMSMITKMRQQFFTVLQSTGFLYHHFHPASTPTSTSTSQQVLRHLNTHSTCLQLVRAIVFTGLYPHVAKMEYGRMKGFGNKDKGRKRILLTTRENLQNLVLHPSSVNARITSFPNPYLAFYEAIRSSDVYLRATSIVSPLILTLFGGDAVQAKILNEKRQQHVEMERKAIQQKYAKKDAEKKKHKMMEQDDRDEHEMDESDEDLQAIEPSDDEKDEPTDELKNEIEAIFKKIQFEDDDDEEEEGYEDEDEEDDDEDDDLPRPNNHPPANTNATISTFAIDEFLAFKMLDEDIQRIHHIRAHINHLLHLTVTTGMDDDIKHIEALKQAQSVVDVIVTLLTMDDDTIIDSTANYDVSSLHFTPGRGRGRGRGRGGMDRGRGRGRGGGNAIRMLGPPVSNSADACRRCGEIGHYARDCGRQDGTASGRGRSHGGADGGPPVSNTSDACRRCGEVGHYARDCGRQDGSISHGRDGDRGFRGPNGQRAAWAEHDSNGDSSTSTFESRGGRGGHGRRRGRGRGHGRGGFDHGSGQQTTPSFHDNNNYNNQNIYTNQSPSSSTSHDSSSSGGYRGRGRGRGGFHTQLQSYPEQSHSQYDEHSREQGRNRGRGRGRGRGFDFHPPVEQF